jgi:hypothetical protein
LANQANTQRGDLPGIGSEVKIHEKRIGKSGLIKVAVYLYGDYGLVAAVNCVNNF